MRLILLVLLVLALVALTWQSFQTSGMASYYPVALTTGALACALVYLAMSLSRLRAAPSGELDEEAALVWPPAVPLLAFVAIWLAYVALLDRVGFMVATWAALWASLVVLGRRVTLRAPVLVGLFVLVLTVLLKRALYVPVPQGWLDERIDILLYAIR